MSFALRTGMLGAQVIFIRQTYRKINAPRSETRGKSIKYVQPVRLLISRA